MKLDVIQPNALLRGSMFRCCEPRTARDSIKTVGFRTLAPAGPITGTAAESVVMPEK